MAVDLYPENMRVRLGAALCLLAAPAFGQRLADLRSTPCPLPPGSTLVVGFLGGFEPWNDNHRSVRKLVLKLRQQPGVSAESVGNHQQKVAVQLIRRALDSNHNGRLDKDERARARIILFGQSWGGGAAVKTARDLDRLGVPVLLTAQVDSVGIHDSLIPANVASAVNFYQHDPHTIRGRDEIRAAQPSQTRIIGNFAASYIALPVPPQDASWGRRKFGGGHAKMELDPEIWNRVESYVLDAIGKR